MPNPQVVETPTMKADHAPPNDVPESTKKPKSRPPTDKREYFFRTPLPYYSGPYSVGMMDIEVAAREPRHFSEIKRDGRHLLELETVLFSVFYPAGIRSGQGRSPEGEKKWSRPTWLPRPRRDIVKGYGKFAGMSSLTSLGWFGTTTAFTKIPAFRNAKLADHWPAGPHSREGGYATKNIAGTPPPGETEQPIFPLLIFSHGLGGTRTTYSSMCGEFASYGFIVVALEHRDGSGPRTIINIPQSEGDGREGEAETGKRKTDVKRSHRTIDYIFPKGNAYDTSPGNSRGVDEELRAAQIQLRLAEIEEAYHVMRQIHDGKGEQVASQDLRAKPGKGGSSRGLRGIDWASWQDRLHLQQVTMLGHSFGAATTVEVLRHKDERFNFIGQGIIYDIWGAAIQPSADNGKHRIRTPLLGISSEAFMYWPDNFQLSTSLCEEAKEQDALVWLMTVRGSVHLSQSDFTLLYPRTSSLFMKMTVNPSRAIDLNISASLEFLKLVMPTRMSAMDRGINEHLLDVPIIDELPEERKPRVKDTGMRLQIPHEFRLRITPQRMRRQARRRRRRREEQEPLPQGPTGKVLVGLEDFAADGEIWMHVAPTREELMKHGHISHPDPDDGRDKDDLTVTAMA